MFRIWCSHETAAEDAAVLPSSTRRSVLFVGSVPRMYGVAAVRVSFKSVFVFPDSYCQSASSVCVSPRQQ